jgi:hypothetical protein
VGDAHEQTLVEKLDLVHAHRGGAAPVRPGRFVHLIIILGREVDDGMEKTEHETFRSPVDNDVNGHVVSVECDFVGIYP